MCDAVSGSDVRNVNTVLVVCSCAGLVCKTQHKIHLDGHLRISRKAIDDEGFDCSFERPARSSEKNRIIRIDPAFALLANSQNAREICIGVRSRM